MIVTGSESSSAHSASKGILNEQNASLAMSTTLSEGHRWHSLSISVSAPAQSANKGIDSTPVSRASGGVSGCSVSVIVLAFAGCSLARFMPGVRHKE